MLDRNGSFSAPVTNSGLWSVAMDNGFPMVVSAMKMGDITRNHMTWTSLGPIRFVKTRTSFKLIKV